MKTRNHGCLLHVALYILPLLLPRLVAAQDQDSRGRESAKPNAHGIVLSNMDPSVRPGDDFYQYANGELIKRIEIPPDRDRAGVYMMVVDLTNKRTATLIEETAKKNAQAGSSAHKIADLYNSYMDVSGIEDRGLSPLTPHLLAIASIRNKRQLARALGESLRADVDPLNNTNFHTANLFGLWVAPEFNDSDHYIPYLLQGGLQLPDREYYLADNDRMRDIRTKYEAHISALLRLAGFRDADTRAERVFELERAIAEKHVSLVENNDIHKANNSWKQADFAANAPGLVWTEYFRAAGLSGQAKFIVWQPQAFIGESSLVASIPLV